METNETELSQVTVASISSRAHATRSQHLTRLDLRTWGLEDLRTWAKETSDCINGEMCVRMFVLICATAESRESQAFLLLFQNACRQTGLLSQTELRSSMMFSFFTQSFASVSFLGNPRMSFHLVRRGSLIPNPIPLTRRSLLSWRIISLSPESSCQLTNIST